MKNMMVAKILYEIADMLEMQDVQFKPRAYRRAARTVESLPEPIEDIVAKDKLEELPGVGPSIAEKIEEIVQTGSSKYHEELKKESPVDLESLMSVGGLGPKTIQVLHKKLGVTTLDDLERAAKQHKIRRVKRLGPQKEQNILENIELAKRKKERVLLGFALPVAQEIRDRLKQVPGVSKVELAGSLRRMKETIGDVDLLVACTQPESVVKVFTTMPEVRKVLERGETKSSVILEDGVQVDLRIVSDESFGSALMYFTGSKDHNIAMRKLAISHGYKLSEYGLFKRDRPIAGETEHNVYGQLGLDFIPPEIREDRGEIDRARAHTLPNLVGYDAIKGDLQSHTKWSDGNATVQDMAEAARALGHSYIAITDHCSSIPIIHGLNEQRFREQGNEIDRVNEKVSGIRVLKGAEVDIERDGSLAAPQGVLKELEIVVASVHGAFKQSKKVMTDRIISAMESGVVHIIGHPTGRKINEKKPSEIDMERLFEVSKRTQTYLEINSQPNRLDLSDGEAKRALESGCKLAINTDSHDKRHLKFIQLGIGVARRAWAENSDIINTQSLDDLLRTLKK